MMSGGYEGTPASPSKARVTHVEVRRVQNGFVVMAMDYARDFYEGRKPTVASFVATDEEQVKTVIGNILTSAELDWMPSVDLPMVEMQRIVATREEGIAKKAAEEAVQTSHAIYTLPPNFGNTLRGR
jgi:hypothetical protein